MNVKEVRDLSNEELEKEVVSLKEELYDLLRLQVLWKIQLVSETSVRQSLESRQLSLNVRTLSLLNKGGLENGRKKQT